jgi:hypothetical protein
MTCHGSTDILRFTQKIAIFPDDLMRFARVLRLVLKDCDCLCPQPCPFNTQQKRERYQPQRDVSPDSANHDLPAQISVYPWHDPLLPETNVLNEEQLSRNCSKHETGAEMSVRLIEETPQQRLTDKN